MFPDNMNTIFDEDNEKSSTTNVNPKNSSIFNQVFGQGDKMMAKEVFEKMIKIRRLDCGLNHLGKAYHYYEGTTMRPIVAIKVKCEPSHKTIVDDLTSEIKILSKLDHKHLIKIYEFYQDHKNFYIFREYLEKGSILDKISKQLLEESIALKYLRQALEGLDYLHKNGIVHGHIRASNLLFTISDDIKLTDFGMNFELNPQNSEARRRITLFHLAPEMFKSLKPTPKSDIWALGCTFVTMLTQNPPHFEYFRYRSTDFIFETLKNHFLHKDVDQLSYSADDLLPGNSYETKKFFNKIMIINEKDRPDAEKILNMSLMKEMAQKFEKSSIEDFFKSEARKRKSTTRSSEHRDSLAKISPENIKIDENGGHSLRNEKSHQSDNQHNPTEHGDLYLLLRFTTSRFLLISSLVLKWILLVILAAILMTTIAALIFTGIFLIYRGIEVACQCELAEGFIALIAIILLPILILLTTLCCNSACEKYKQAVESGEIRKSRFYVAPPERNLNIFGIKLILGEKNHKRKSGLAHTQSRKRLEEEDLTSPMLLSKGKLINNIAELA